MIILIYFKNHKFVSGLEKLIAIQNFAFGGCVNDDRVIGGVVVVAELRGVHQARLIFTRENQDISRLVVDNPRSSKLSVSTVVVGPLVVLEGDRQLQSVMARSLSSMRQASHSFFDPQNIANILKKNRSSHISHPTPQSPQSPPNNLHIISTRIDSIQ